MDNEGRNKEVERYSRAADPEKLDLPCLVCFVARSKHVLADRPRLEYGRKFYNRYV